MWMLSYSLKNMKIFAVAKKKSYLGIVACMYLKSQRLRGGGLKDQDFKIILNYIVSSRATQAETKLNRGISLSFSCDLYTNSF